MEIRVGSDKERKKDLPKRQKSENYWREAGGEKGKGTEYLEKEKDQKVKITKGITRGRREAGAEVGAGVGVEEDWREEGEIR